MIRIIELPNPEKSLKFFAHMSHGPFYLFDLDNIFQSAFSGVGRKEYTRRILVLNMVIICEKKSIKAGGDHHELCKFQKGNKAKGNDAP